jgi:hypothetical protein
LVHDLGRGLEGCSWVEGEEIEANRNIMIPLVDCICSSRALSALYLGHSKWRCRGEGNKSGEAEGRCELHLEGMNLELRV